MAARARMLNGERLGFDQEAKALYDACSRPDFDDAHFDSLLARLDSLLPGSAARSPRFQRFRDRMVLSPGPGGHRLPAPRSPPAGPVPAPACRCPRASASTSNTCRGRPGTPTTGTRGTITASFRSTPICPSRWIARWTSPAMRATPATTCTTRRPRAGALTAAAAGWRSPVYPLFSPQSLIAEGSANYGIDMVFSRGGAGCVRARLDCSRSPGSTPRWRGANAAVREVIEDLELRPATRSPAAISTGSSAAAAGGGSHEPATGSRRPMPRPKALRFIDTYRELTSSTTTWGGTWWPNWVAASSGGIDLE